jgi:hypothetical protein
VYTSRVLAPWPFVIRAKRRRRVTESRQSLVGRGGGSIVWNAWSFFVYHFITGHRYVRAQDAGLFLKTPRYPFFADQWIALLFILSIAVAHLYAWARQGLGPVRARR